MHGFSSPTMCKIPFQDAPFNEVSPTRVLQYCDSFCAVDNITLRGTHYNLK